MAIIFVWWPHCAFMCVSRARFQSKGEVQAKKLPSAGRMWPVGRMLTPPVLGGKGSWKNKSAYHKSLFAKSVGSLNRDKFFRNIRKIQMFGSTRIS
jgi:hypothetical protein